MAQEAHRTCTKSISARLKDTEQITNFSARQGHIAREGVERRAQGTDDVHDFGWLGVELVKQGNGIISLDCLAQISRGGQMVIHAAVQHYEFLAAGDLDIVNSGKIDASFAGQEAPRFHQKLRPRERGIAFNFSKDRRKCRPKFRKIQLLLVWKIWNPDA